MSFHTFDTDTNKISVIYNTDELTKAVHDTLDWYKSGYEQLQKENSKLRTNGKEIAEQSLKDEIARLERKLSFSYGEFATQKEKDAYDDFERRHMHQRLTMKIQGGKCPYLIPTGTGIGTILKVVCPICGESEDITDMEAW